jgi:hypothetical protein
LKLAKRLLKPQTLLHLHDEVVDNVGYLLSELAEHHG